MRDYTHVEMIAVDQKQVAHVQSRPPLLDLSAEVERPSDACGISLP